MDKECPTPCSIVSFAYTLLRTAYFQLAVVRGLRSDIGHMERLTGSACLPAGRAGWEQGQAGAACLAADRGWAPKVGLEEGLRKTIEWYRGYMRTGGL